MEWGLIPNTASQIQKFLEWYFVFRLCKIWYFVFLSASAIWYLRSVSVIILVFRLPFSFCNLVFAFSFCNYFGILSRRYLFSFCNLCSVSAIWYFVSAAFTFWFSVTIDYGYWKRWFASVCECEVGWKELFVLELCNEKFP